MNPENIKTTGEEVLRKFYGVSKETQFANFLPLQHQLVRWDTEAGLRDLEKLAEISKSCISVFICRPHPKVGVSGTLFRIFGSANFSNRTISLAVFPDCCPFLFLPIKDEDVISRIGNICYNCFGLFSLTYNEHNCSCSPFSGQPSFQRRYKMGKYALPATIWRRLGKLGIDPSFFHFKVQFLNFLRIFCCFC